MGHYFGDGRLLYNSGGDKFGNFFIDRLPSRLVKRWTKIQPVTRLCTKRVFNGSSSQGRVLTRSRSGGKVKLILILVYYRTLTQRVLCSKSYTNIKWVIS